MKADPTTSERSGGRLQSDLAVPQSPDSLKAPSGARSPLTGGGTHPDESASNRGTGFSSGRCSECPGAPVRLLLGGCRKSSAPSKAFSSGVGLSDCDVG